MSKFPYAGLPQQQIWKRAVTDVAADDVDPQAPGRFRFDRQARIASAGSCFALRIADALRTHGFRYLVTETGSSEANFGRYSARYGDIYTTLQLNGLVQRAFGLAHSDEPAWSSGGRYFDPLRPRAVPGGFASVAELEADRSQHYAAVRRMIGESDVFVFTLGLTETWCSHSDGTAFPLCPGAGIGTFDDARYVYRNLDVDENVAELEAFLALASSVNPALRVIFTISPVPLAATMEPQHVMTATMYSKSVLRVAAETIRRRHANVDYFASYEIVMAAARDGFEPDGREVTPETVARVMRSFFRAFADEPPAAVLPPIDLTLGAVQAAPVVDLSSDVCNEAYLASFVSRM